MIVGIGPRINWLGLFTALLLILIVFGVGISPAWNGLTHAAREGQNPIGYILGLAALSGIVLFVAYNIALAVFGSELIVVTSSDLEIQSRVIGRVRSQRSFPNSTIENLRYEEWWSGARGTPRQQGIRFECVGETVTFARNATTAEAQEILHRMQQLYSFPMVDPPDAESSPAVMHW
ncbi:MAG: hypothetical protein ACLGSD_09010 [Acidobacteriota bacterium]